MMHDSFLKYDTISEIGWREEGATTYRCSKRCRSQRSPEGPHALPCQHFRTSREEKSSGTGTLVLGDKENQNLAFDRSTCQTSRAARGVRGARPLFVCDADSGNRRSPRALASRPTQTCANKSKMAHKFLCPSPRSHATNATFCFSLMEEGSTISHPKKEGCLLRTMAGKWLGE